MCAELNTHSGCFPTCLVCCCRNSRALSLALSQHAAQLAAPPGSIFFSCLPGRPTPHSLPAPLSCTFSFFASSLSSTALPSVGAPQGCILGSLSCSLPSVLSPDYLFHSQDSNIIDKVTTPNMFMSKSRVPPELPGSTPKRHPKHVARIEFDHTHASYLSRGHHAIHQSLEPNTEDPSTIPLPL